MRCPTRFTMAVCWALEASLFCCKKELYWVKLIESICESGTRSNWRRPVTGTVEQLTAANKQLARKILLNIIFLLFSLKKIAFYFAHGQLRFYTFFTI